MQIIIGLPILKRNRPTDIVHDAAPQTWRVAQKAIAAKPKPEPTALGTKTRMLRKSRGLNQIQLAAKLGIAQGSLSDIETGVIKEISGKVLAGLCRELRAMPDFFMSEEPGDTDFGEMHLAQQEAVFLLGSMKPDLRERAIGALRGIAGTLATSPKRAKS